MQYQAAKYLSRGGRIKETATGEFYIVERIEDNRQSILIYGREERTKKPRCFDHRKVEKASLILEMRKMIADKSLYDWKKDVPALYEMLQYKEQLWINPDKEDPVPEVAAGFGKKDMEEAAKRMVRFAPYIEKVFPETAPMRGRIRSELIEIPAMLENLKETDSENIKGKLYLKCDDQLPVAGSVKARGGIYEVLYHAEALALENGLLKENDDYSVLADERFRKFFSNYTIAVGSTGNLGLSIGIAAAAFGFHAVVHLSQDAKEWKKQELKKRGVTVVEYAGDYEKAVEEGRKAAEAEEYTYFIDDENSKILFSGYTTAAWELAEQLAQQQIITDRQHPLFVYLPCGVGGGPGGITFGLKQIFGSSVHCFFAEPTHAPCMMLSLATGRGRELGIKDFGLDNKTEADGLAVGRASGFAAAVMGPMLDGCYTVGDEKLFAYLKLLAKSENKKLEPSALAGMGGPYQLFGTKRGKEYLEENGIEDGEEITHVVWATGGGLVPEDVMRTYLSTG